MATLRALTTDPARAVVDAVVVGLAGGAGPDATPALVGGCAELDAAFGGRLTEALVAAGARGRLGETVRIPTLGALRAASVLAVGLGDAAGTGPHADAETGPDVDADSGTRFSHDALRRASGTAVRALAGATKVATTLAAANGTLTAESVRAVAEGSLLGSYDFVAFRQVSRAGRPSPVAEVSVLTAAGGLPPAAVRAELARAAIVAEAVALARDLVNTPPGDLPPGRLAEIATEQAKAAGVTVEVLDERDLRRGGFGGLIGVGQGSVRPPRLVRLSWPGVGAAMAGRGATGRSTAGRRRAGGPAGAVHLVGKGITFDSGGLSLKPPASMEWMKSDMAGSASVLACVLAAARLKLAVPVTGWMALAENMPSGSAIRPGDVLSLYGGTLVEVLNTDAEGRLVLGDALARACEEQPRALIDVATLTGAQIVALGHRVAGLMGNDDALRDRLLAAAEVAGESLWPMPLPAELRKGLDSAVADLKNIGDAKAGGGMLVAGLFLREFVTPGVAWAHLDIAGPSYNEGEAWGATPRGGTGMVVATLVRYLEDLVAD